MKVAIIGSGRQGGRRASAVKECGDEVRIAVDTNISYAKALAKECGCKASANWKDAIADSRVDAVLVCTPNDTHAEISIAALNSGKNVLCEKPMARNVEESAAMLKASEKSSAVFKCGFNHRHHPAVMQAKGMVDRGALGKLMFMRCRYGITGRVGYEKDWRMDISVSGGGQLMDQGQHVLDLFRWFGGEIREVSGYTDTLYWNVKPVDDNAFAMMRAKAGHICSMHVSWTEWRNIFSFEVFGKAGYVKVEGLGGSYGIERLIRGKMDLDAPFSEDVREFDGPDRSFVEEWKEFSAAISEGREPLGSAVDGYEALRLSSAIYESSKEGRSIRIT